MRFVTVCVVAICCQIALFDASGFAEPADGVRLSTRVDLDSVTVGQRFHIVHELEFPDSLTLVPPQKLDPGNCRLIDVGWIGPISEGSLTRQTATLTMMTTGLDNAQVPGLRFVFETGSGDTLTIAAADVEIPVRLIAAVDSEPKPLKPQWRAPRSLMPYYVGAGAVALALLALYFWRKRRGRAVEEKPVPVLPADFVALRTLGEIENMNLLENGEFKKYYTLVADAVRVYLENRFSIQAMDRTTAETADDLRAERIDIAGLESFLGAADLVKFAKFEPDVPSARLQMESAKDIVVKTAPKPAFTAES